METRELAHALTRFALFEGLSQQTRQCMAEHIHLRRCSEGELIVLTGEPSRAVYLIAEGQVRIERLSQEGREYVLHILKSGQCFNLSSALDGGYSLGTAEALTDTVVYALPSDIFCQVVREHPELAMVLLGHLAGRVRRLCDAVEDLALYPVRTRLARRLLSAANEDAPTVQSWTQDEIARHIGTVRDVVGRTLRAFAHEGLIQRERGRLVVTDAIGLKREAMVG